MMKLGCLSLSYSNTFDNGAMDLPRFIDKAYELGLDGVEIHARHFASTDPEYLRDLRMRCLKRGLGLSYIGVSNNFGKPQPELDEQVELVKHWVDVAEFVGVPMVRIFAAWVAEGEDEERVWERMMPCMKEVARHGEDKGVILGLQNHNRWCVTRTGKDVKRIIEGVNSPYFLHILDTGQYVGSPGADGAEGKEDPTYDFYGSIEETAPMATHVRAKIYRIGTGVEAWLDYPRIFGILRNVDYNGWVSVVYEGQVAEAEETAIPKAARYLRSLMLEE